MQEITEAKPVRDTNFIALKAFSAMRFLGTEVSSVQFRVGAPISQSSQRSSRFHTPAVSRAALETATSLRSSSYGSAGHFRLHAAACGFLL